MSVSPIKSSYILFGLALLLTVALRLPFLHISFFSVDEAVSAVAGMEILKGGLPYQDAIDHRGPLTYYAYAGIFAVLGLNDMIAVHWVYLGLMLVLTWGIWRLGNRYFSEAVSGWSAIIFAIISWSNPFHEMWAAHTEWLLTAFSLLGMWLWLSARKRWYFLIVSGVAFGICALSKQVGLLELGAVLSCISFRCLWDKFQGWQAYLRETAFLLIGWTIPVGVIVTYFCIQGAWDDWIFYVWRYNTEYYMPEISLVSRFVNSSKMLGAFFLNKWLLMGLVLWAGYKLYERFESFVKLPHLWLLCWAGVALLEALVGGRAFLHYLIPTLIPLSLIAGWGIEQLLEEKILGKWLRPLVVLGLGIAVLITWYHHVFMLDSDTSVTEFDPFVAEIQANTSEDEPVFIWGFAPEIYVLSNRRSASKFSFCNVLTGHIPAGNETKVDTRYAIVPGTWEELMEELAQSPPLYIVDTQPADYRAYGKYPMKNYPLGSLIKSQYVLDRSFHQRYPDAIFHLYKRRTPPLQTK